MKSLFTHRVEAEKPRFCFRALSLLLSVVMVCNMGTEALGAVLSSAELTARVNAKVEKAEREAVVPPADFLSNLREELEKVMSAEAPLEPLPEKMSAQEFKTQYQQEVNTQYAAQEKALEQELQQAMAEFDSQADAERNRAKNSLPLGGSLAELTQVETYIRQKRTTFETHLNEEKAKFLAELQADKETLLSQKTAAYAQYVRDFDKAMQEVAQSQVTFYRELIHQVLTNYTQAKKSPKAKDDFVTIMTYLTSLSNKDEIFVGEDRTQIQNELWLNFTVKSHACAGGVHTEFKDDSQWGSSFVGGSPSAGRMLDVKLNKEQVFRLADEKACNLAISSLLPFANLDGEGWKITNFMQANFDNLLFGQILLIGTKALLMTKNGGMSALDKFVTKAIEKENAGRHKTMWDRLDILTFAGGFKGISFDGTYFGHNVSSSAQRNRGEPNVWEDVAEMLAKVNTPAATAILKKAIDQCKVVSVANDGMYQTVKRKQKFSCRGIYPFLFGVITQKPELANALEIEPLYAVSSEGYEMDARGNQHYVTAQEAQNRRHINKTYGLEHKISKGELLAGIFYGTWFEDLYPEDKQRMDSKVALLASLNPKGEMKAYSTSSDYYHKMRNRFNAKSVFVALGSAFDYMVTLLLIRTLGGWLFKAASLVKGASSAMKVRQVIMAYRLVPNSVRKSTAMAHALQAKNLGVAQLGSYKKFATKINNIRSKAVKVRQFPSQVVTRFREANAQKIHFGEPFSAPYVSRVKQAGMRGPAGEGAWTTPDWAEARAAWRDPIGKTAFDEPTIATWSDFSGAYIKRPAGKIWNGIKNYWKEGGWPGTTVDGGGTLLKPEKITFVLKDKKGNTIPVETLSVKKGVLIADNTMLKAFKAYLPMDQLEALAALSREEQISLGFDGMWVKLVSKTKPSRWDKIRALDKNVETVPLYNADGKPLLHVGFNPGIKADAELLTKLSGKNPASKLVFKDGKIHLFENGTLIRGLEGIEELSIPKTAFSNVIGAGKLSFLEKLFALDKGASGALRMEFTKNKLLFPFAVNFLSYSAAASALSMTLENDLGWSPVLSTMVGFTAPYLTAPLAPLLVPYVKRFGARRVLNASLATATVSLGLAVGTGWNGNGLEKGEDGKKHAVAPKGTLLLNAALTGLASTGLRAVSGIVVKGYETSESVMALSMIGKSIGAMLTTAIPAGIYLVSSVLSDKSVDLDFDIAFPIMLALTVGTGLGLRLTIPNKTNRAIHPVKDFFKPFKQDPFGTLLQPGRLFKPYYQVMNSSPVWPYVAGMTLMNALEGYVYFKGLQAWSRNQWEKTGVSGSPAKFLGALSMAIPQLIWRSSGSMGKALLGKTGWTKTWGRKGAWGKGVTNSAVLALGGGLLFMNSDEDDFASGVLSGLMLGAGTANIFQYNQKLLLKSVSSYNSSLSGAAKAAMIDEKAAMAAYSAGNFGFALPVVPAIFAGELRKGDPERGQEGESEITATKHTAQIPLIAYLSGLGMITLAELNQLSRAGVALKTGFQFLKPAVAATVLGGNAALLIKQINTPKVAVHSNGLENKNLLNAVDLSVPPLQLNAPSLSRPSLWPAAEQAGFGEPGLLNKQPLLMPSATQVNIPPEEETSAPDLVPVPAQ